MAPLLHKPVKATLFSVSAVTDTCGLKTGSAYLYVHI